MLIGECTTIVCRLPLYKQYTIKTTSFTVLVYNIVYYTTHNINLEIHTLVDLLVFIGSEGCYRIQ